MLSTILKPFSGLEQYQIALAVLFVVIPFLAVVLVYSFYPIPSKLKVTAYSYGRFFYASFLKPHTGDGNGGQQGALESFYKAQASFPAGEQRYFR